MTRDDIIRMAQEAGFPGWWLTPPEPERQHGESLEIIELAGDGERQGGQGQHQAAAPAPAARAPQRPAAPASSPSPSSGFDDMDSDIPF